VGQTGADSAGALRSAGHIPRRPVTIGATRLHRPWPRDRLLRWRVRQEVYLCFAARLIGGHLSVSDESTEVRWVAPQAIEELPMHESIRLRKHFLEHRATPAIAWLAPYQATFALTAVGNQERAS
jgi:hypothetical protein